MAHALTCPSCGETDDLRGEPHQDDIRVTCGACGAVWMRGAPVCASCGGGDIAERPQAMTRHSRGTQLSIIGWRQIPLCRACDAEALRTSIDQNVPVPGGYVSAALHAPGTRRLPPAGTEAGTAPGGSPTQTRRPEPGGRPAPRPATEAHPSGKAAAARPAPRAAGTDEGGARPAPERRPAPPRPPKATPAPSSVPTVRQAIAAFLAEASGEVDQTAMLLLGTHLGSCNRLGVLEGESAATALAEWFDKRWEARDGAAGHRARETLCRAVDFWGARGWLASDPAAGLR